MIGHVNELLSGNFLSEMMSVVQKFNLIFAEMVDALTTSVKPIFDHGVETMQMCQQLQNKNSLSATNTRYRGLNLANQKNTISLRYVVGVGRYLYPKLIQV